MDSFSKFPSVSQPLYIYWIFEPPYLNIPSIICHLPLVVTSTLFYHIVYTVLGPFILSLLPASDSGNANKNNLPPNNRSAKLSAYHFRITLVSISQSFVNSMLAIYLLSHTEFRQGLSAQERYLGYHEESAQALSIATGYFCFHAVETWLSRDVWGNSMFIHGVCALISVVLGFVSSYPIKDSRHEA